MSKHRNDIAQIKKYISGELDARAMHRLERRALDDPFLADALEGYQHAGKDQRENLADLSARLQNRIDNNKVKRLIPWRSLSIAASILVIIGVGVWLMTRNKPSEDKQMMANLVKPADTISKKKEVATPPAGLAQVKQDTLKPLALAKSKRRAAQNDAATATPPSVHDLEVAQVQSNEPQPAASAARVDTALFVRKAPATSNSQNLASVDPNKVTPNKDYGYSNQAAVQTPAPTYKSNPQGAQQVAKAPSNQPTLLQTKVEGLDVKPANKTLTGTVTDLAGTPLAGAVVKMAGTNFGVITDENGHFIIHDAPDKNSLTVGYIGYDNKQVKLNGDDSVNIALVPAKTLNDVTITGSMASKRVTDAHPSAGWKALDTYLSKNAVSPDGQTGKVYLSFTVDAQGNLNNFTILKSLSTAADQKAIDLLTKGPGWAGAADGQTHEVKLTVEFK